MTTSVSQNQECNQITDHLISHTQSQIANAKEYLQKINDLFEECLIAVDVANKTKAERELLNGKIEGFVDAKPNEHAGSAAKTQVVASTLIALSEFDTEAEEKETIKEMKKDDAAQTEATARVDSSDSKPGMLTTLRNVAISAGLAFGTILYVNKNVKNGNIKATTPYRFATDLAIQVAFDAKTVGAAGLQVGQAITSRISDAIESAKTVAGIATQKVDVLAKRLESIELAKWLMEYARQGTKRPS